MALRTARSERMFCEQLDYNLLLRWFRDLKLDDPIRKRVQMHAYIVTAAYNLMRIARLAPAPA